jgi:hypothetical protein
MAVATQSSATRCVLQIISRILKPLDSNPLLLNYNQQIYASRVVWPAGLMRKDQQPSREQNRTHSDMPPSVAFASSSRRFTVCGIAGDRCAVCQHLADLHMHGIIILHHSVSRACMSCSRNQGFHVRLCRIYQLLDCLHAGSALLNAILREPVLIPMLTPSCGCLNMPCPSSKQPRSQL